MRRHTGVALGIVAGLLFLGVLGCGVSLSTPSGVTPIPATPTPSISTPTPNPTATATPTPPLVRSICDGDNDAVVLLLDPSLASGIRSGLDLFEDDLCNEGYSVIERLADFANPTDVRAYLAGLYAETERRLKGAILVGNIPYAYQWVISVSGNPKFPSTKEETISYQYYADLDGIFDKSSDYVSPGKHSYSYDVHSGQLDWEIWIGVLPIYKGDYDITIDALNRYFQKNHDYRAGRYDIPRAFLEISEFFTVSTIEEHNRILESLRTGAYAWTPFSDSPNARIYFNSPPGGLSAAQGYADLSAGVADFTVGDAHGYWGGHGQLDIQWVESNPLKTVFFWSNGCGVANLDFRENVLTSFLYSPTSMILVAKGTTNNSGGMGNNENGFFGHNIATALSQGETFGQAILDHVNTPLISPWSNSREFHFATVVILGDPTLKLRQSR